jgi:hypothetical protein
MQVLSIISHTSENIIKPTTNQSAGVTVSAILWFQDAKRDETARRAYKLLATLHSDCSELVQMVEETGATVREIRDLEEQVMLTILGFVLVCDVE